MTVYAVPRFNDPLAPPIWPLRVNRDTDLAQGLAALIPLVPGSGPFSIASHYWHGIGEVVVPTEPVYKGTTIGPMMSFDGTNQLVNLATGVAFAAPGSLAFWVQSTNDAWNTVFAGQNSASPNNVWLVVIGNSVTATLTNEIITIFRTSAGTNQFTIGYTTATRTELFDGLPHHIAIVSNDTATAIYLDGKSKTVSTGAGTDNGDFFGGTWTTNSITLGALNNDSAGYRLRLNGCMGHVGVWTRALTALDVARLYDPATRWDLYWRPKRQAYFSITAATGHGPLVGQRLIRGTLRDQLAWSA